MKSKSSELRQSGHDNVKENRSFDFAKLYKSAAETKTQFDSAESTEMAKKVNKIPESESGTSKRSRSPIKNKKKKVNETLESSHIVAGDNNSSGIMTTTSSKKKTHISTPRSKEDKSETNVKSIMKSKSHVDESINTFKVISSGSKPKKRNKSVSFMLDDSEEVIVKKSKSNDSAKEDKDKEKLPTKKSSKNKKQMQLKQENKNINKVNSKVSVNNESQKKEAAVGTKPEKVKEVELKENVSDGTVLEANVKVKKGRKFNPQLQQDVKKTEDATEDQSSESKSKKMKKKKRKAKALQDTNAETDDEPVVKSRKRELKPDTIAKGLENLNIGDNPYTLSHLLDEMSVVDKNKKRKDKQNQKNTKVNKGVEPKVKNEQANNVEVEKVKWNHRKWNKDTKGEASKPRLQTSVVVDNLPISIMCNYKKLLSEHFAKFGTIIGIGVAETYPNEDPQPVFTTTIYFQDEEAAIKALEEDNTIFKDSRSRIRVRRPLPPAQTTLVVRAFAELGQQTLSSLFASAGRIRSIRHLIKGKKTISTAFVQFDGPEAVERALKLAEDAKICGKKMYVAKFENRVHRKKENDGVNDISTD